MGSLEAQDTVLGTFNIPIFDHVSDPSERGYLMPPPWQSDIKRTYPLINFRHEALSGVTTKSRHISRSEEFLTRYGFTVVKHKSTIINSSMARDDVFDSAIIEKYYYPEVVQLIKDLTDCKHVFIEHSFLRGQPRSQQTSGARSAMREQAVKKLDTLNHNHSYHLPAPIPPTRVPHVDNTPLGGRCAIRFWRNDLKDAAERAGIIEMEDAICDRHQVKATEKVSDAVLAKEYNANGKLGPRYASYSVWRPIKKVTRDPLALAVRQNVKALDDDLYLWSYYNRNYGIEGDWVQELEMLRVKSDQSVETTGKVDESINWYYLPEQELDEVLVFKLFDSAGLSADTEESEGVVHGSPDLGDAGYGGPRESIEVRLYAVW